MSEFKQFQSETVSFLSEAGATLTFFCFVFCVKAKNDVGFGARPQRYKTIRTQLIINIFLFHSNMCKLQSEED